MHRSREKEKTKPRLAVLSPKVILGVGAVLLAVLFFDLRTFFWPPPQPPANEEEREAQEYQAFLHQKLKDELVKLTENSFFGPRLRPLAGRPVLLAAGVKTWNRPEGEVDEDPNMVQFEIVQGKGRLVPFLEYVPGEATTGVASNHLVIPAMDGYEAFVWFLSDENETGETVVKATLAPMGRRKIFIDPGSQVLFHVHPVPVSIAPHWDVRRLREREYGQRALDHSEFSNNFIFSYPSSFGVYRWEPRASLYQGGFLRFFRKDPQGKVVEAPTWEEKKTWDMELQKWHSLPPDLKGLLTHVDPVGGRLGLLTHSQYDPLYGGKGNDQFLQARWEISQYRTQFPQAGPEDLWVFRTEEEDPHSPLQVEVSRTHHQDLQVDGKIPFWSETEHWTCAVGNMHSIYDLTLQKRTSFQARPLAPEKLMAGLAVMVNPLETQLSERTVDLSSYGLSFRDVTPDLADRFRKTGHPPGPMVTQLDAKSSLADSGLMPGDILLMVNWEQTDTADKLKQVLQKVAVGEPLTLLFWRQASYHWGEFTPTLPF